MNVGNYGVIVVNVYQHLYVPLVIRQMYEGWPTIPCISCQILDTPYNIFGKHQTSPHNAVTNNGDLSSVVDTLGIMNTVDGPR